MAATASARDTGGAAPDHLPVHRRWEHDSDEVLRNMHCTPYRIVVTVVLPTLVASGLMPAAPAAAQDGQPPPEVRAIIEGTWELVEWHVGDQVVRSPQMEGRWMVHDGIVMATRHRIAPDGFESTAGYGEYRWGPTTWTYGYERSEDLRGPSPDDAALRITGSTPVRMSTFEITRDGDQLILDGDVLRWEYDLPEGTFLLRRATGEPIRKYRRITGAAGQDPDQR